MNWDDVRRDWVYVPYKGENRKLKLYQYLKAISDLLPDGRIKISDPKIDHKPALKEAYMKSGLDGLHAEAARIIDLDYIAKCKVYWNLLSDDLLGKIEAYLQVPNAINERIDILLQIDKQEFVPRHGVTIEEWERIEEALQRVQLKFDNDGD